MPVIKNEIPILEYDPEQKAIFMPEGNAEIEYPRTMVMLFMDQEVDEYAEDHSCRLVAIMNTIPRLINIWETELEGKNIGFCKTMLGGPAAVEMMEMLYANGVRNFVACGCCGALIEDKEGDFLIPVAALRQEGTSYQYLPPAREVETDQKVNDAIRRAAKEAGYSTRDCRTWTTDGLFRETPDMVAYRKSEGYAVVEMECASMAACAKMRGAAFGQLLFTADSLADDTGHDARDWGRGTFAKAMRVALKAAAKL